MHGLINRAIQSFVSDTYGAARWQQIAQLSGLGFTEFEAMLSYDPAVAPRILAAAVRELDKPRETLLEDLGTYLVSHPNTEALRRLMRFGGDSFLEFLHSLDDLPERARLAVSDLDLPELDLDERGPGRFRLACRGGPDGVGHVLVGLLRAMADDYGALVYLELRPDAGGAAEIDITLYESAYAAGRRFDLGAPAL